VCDFHGVVTAMQKYLVMMDDNAVEWLNLPRELWLDIISKKLNEFDVLPML
jgi:hypothetical protein